jgi:hypothetical protein
MVTHQLNYSSTKKLVTSMCASNEAIIIMAIPDSQAARVKEEAKPITSALEHDPANLEMAVRMAWVKIMPAHRGDIKGALEELREATNAGIEKAAAGGAIVPRLDIINKAIEQATPEARTTVTAVGPDALGRSLGRAAATGDDATVDFIERAYLNGAERQLAAKIAAEKAANGNPKQLAAIQRDFDQWFDDVNHHLRNSGKRIVENKDGRPGTDGNHFHFEKVQKM